MAEEKLRFKRELLLVSGLLLLGSLMIVFPFLDAIILAIATSYLLRFAHRKINRRLNNEFLSSIIVISSVIGFFTLGIFLFINNFNQIIGGLNIFAIDLQQDLQTLIETLNLPENFRSEATRFIQGVSEASREWLQGTLTSIPSLLIDMGIYLVTSIYLYKDGAELEKKIFELIESFPRNEEKILKSLIRSADSIFRGVFMTQFVVAVVVGIVSGIGFYIISIATSPIPFTALWAFLIALAGLLPLLAAFMFYGPIGIYYIFTGAPIKGALIIVFGILFLNVLTEVLIRPWIGSRQMDEHPLIIFLGFLAGPLTLGLKGLIIGPLVLILSKEFILNYGELVSEGPAENHTENKEE